MWNDAYILGGINVETWFFARTGLLFSLNCFFSYIGGSLVLPHPREPTWQPVVLFPILDLYIYSYWVLEVTGETPTRIALLAQPDPDFQAKRNPKPPTHAYDIFLLLIGVLREKREWTDTRVVQTTVELWEHSQRRWSTVLGAKGLYWTGSSSMCWTEHGTSSAYNAASVNVI